MTRSTPLADLIRSRKQELGLTDEALGRRLGYTNTAKAAGRVHALCNGLPLGPKSRLSLRRLPVALGIPSDAVLQAEAGTDRIFAVRESEAKEQRRVAQEAEDTDWRASFRPHGIIQTERTVPSQITLCGLAGGVRCRLEIPFDLSRSPITYIQQSVEALPGMLRTGDDGIRYATFFGRAVGLIINYSPDHALRCDLEGKPLQILEKAYRVGEVRLSFGGASVLPTVVSKMFGAP